MGSGGSELVRSHRHPLHFLPLLFTVGQRHRAGVGQGTVVDNADRPPPRFLLLILLHLPPQPGTVRVEVFSAFYCLNLNSDVVGVLTNTLEYI